MDNKIKKFTKEFLKKELPDIRPGYTIRVHQIFKEGEKERTQIFEGVVLAKKHGTGINSSIIVRKEVAGVGIERTFPLHLPSIKQIEVLRRAKTKRSKLYYLRTAKGKRARLKRKKI